MASAVMIGVALAGTAISAVGQMRQAKAQAQAQEFIAKLALRDREIAQDNARNTRMQTAENVRRQRIASRRKLGSQRTALGASGVTGGSAMDVLAESAANAELDALTMEYEGKLKERSFLNQGSASGAESEMLRSRSKSTRSAGMISASGTLLSGAGQAVNMYQNAKLKQT